jgi:hypothetical protein
MANSHDCRLHPRLRVLNDICMRGRWAWWLRGWGRFVWFAVAAGLIGLTVWAALLARTQPDLENRLSLIGLAVADIGAIATIRAIPSKTLDITPDQLLRIADELDWRLRESEGEVLERLLDQESARIDVGFMLDPMPGRNAAGAWQSGSLNRVLDYYRELSPRRLAIIGAPGSGKTVMALELQRRLLETRSGGGPVPVRFPLSAWAEGRDLKAWLAEQLRVVYQVPPPIAQALIRNGLVIPVLDGIDEMDSVAGEPDRAASLIRSLNRWLRGSKNAPVILTCRDELYERLGEYRRLLDAAVVRLADLTPEQAAGYVEERAIVRERWRTVIERLRDRRDTALATALNTPWLLSLAIMLYNEEPAGQSAITGSAHLPGELIDHSDDMHEHLLRDYVRTATQAHPPRSGRPYQPERVERWLSELAAYLDGNARTVHLIGGKRLSGTDIVLHELWPIAGEQRPRRVDTALAAAMSIPGWVWFGVFAFTHDVFWRVLFLVALAGYAAALWRITSAFWVDPRPVDLRAVLSPRGLAQLLISAGCGAIVALVFSPAVGAVVGFGAWVAGGLSISPVQGLVTRVLPVTSPSTLLRGDLRLSLISAMSVAPSCGLAFSLYLGPWVGWPCGVCYAVIVGLTVASAPWRRYIALLLCTRHRLPWRLSRFLDWACEANLMRKSGIAYQFRHRELQDWLSTDR